MKTFVKIILVFLIIISNSAFSQWIQMSNGISSNQWIPCFIVSGNYILAGTDYNGVYRTSNNGTNWVQTSLNSQFVNCFAILGSNVLTGTNTGLFLSSNNGLNWTLTAWNSGVVNALAVNGNKVFAGTGIGIFYSTNNGNNWTQTTLNKSINTIAVYGDTILAGTVNNPNGTGGVYISPNNGTSWFQSGLNYETVFYITTIGVNIFAGVGNHHGVFKSTTNAAIWDQTALNNQTVNALAVSGNNIFAGTVDSGVYLSTNLGTNWSKVNQGFITAEWIESFAIINNYILAGSYYNSIWRRPLSQLVNLHSLEKNIPDKYSLNQNYPNPFNPSTTIKYQIPKEQVVELKVFDIIGKEIESLVNKKQLPGTYEVIWDASRFASGVYFYKLETKDFVEVKSMILIK